MANIREFLYDNQYKLVDATSLLHLLVYKHDIVFDSGKENNSTLGEIVLLKQIIKDMDDMHENIETLLESTKEV